MNEQDAIEWEKFRESSKSRLHSDEVELIARLHAHYYKHKYKKPCTCNPRQIQAWINDLNQTYLENRTST